ncbi:MAG: UDP-4-amino-4,6-dideoxy-N-acetyl-beta-L-altrosamine transaminase [Magnetococcales bacterium]|nr:UDP-4-amino-4,6-dideoxy-N-acetyl-beta-L-altrosamine transaminase [Magnetococcales bacterium]
MEQSPTAFLPYGRQSIDETDIDSVVELLQSNWLTTGPKVIAFERALAARVEARHAVSCSSGTAALHLAALALGLGPGDLVIVPSITFLATANAVRFVGADVLFADVDPETGLMGEAEFKAAFDRAGPEQKRIKAVFPVHMNGQSAPMEAIHRFARQQRIAVVEDACHALGGRVGAADGQSRLVGCCAFSDLTIFSFHPVKTIAMGEGGAVVTQDDRLAEKLLRLRSHGMTQNPENFQNPHLARDGQGRINPWYYEMTDLGYNYRASAIHCALGLSQLGRLDRFVAKRRALVARYDQAFQSLSPHIRLLGRLPDAEPAWHLYVLRIDFQTLGLTRAAFMESLWQENIGSQVHYLPVYRQPYYCVLYGEQFLPGAESYYAQAISIPLYYNMQAADVDRVVSAVTGIVKAQESGVLHE